MNTPYKTNIALIALVTIFFCFSYTTATAQIKTVYNTPYPNTIRVAIRANNNPVSPILYVQTVGFEQYCEDVLPNEWIPSWNPEALRAGAIAVKMFAWYYTKHPTSEQGFTYDVDNTTNFQTFKFLSGQYATDLAVQQTWKMVFVPPNGEIDQLNYRMGVPHSNNSSYIGTGMMSQWGSEYLGSKVHLSFGKILRMYYPEDELKFT